MANENLNENVIRVGHEMKSIFESGEFLNERIQDSTYRELLTESRQFSQCGVISHKTTIFLSHKHQDLEDLKGVIGLLRNKYNAQVYIDSMDDKMPLETTGETARRIKQIIEKSNKFIFSLMRSLDAAFGSGTIPF